MDQDAKGSSGTSMITPVEEEEFQHLAASPSVYETIAISITPSIYGGIDMKKAIAYLFFGG